jgi:sugar fermentation stimulation protein A
MSEPFRLILYPAVSRAVTVKRHNRFVAGVRRPDGAGDDVHVPNSGRLPELFTPGLPCLLVHYGGARKYPSSVVAVYYDGAWVLIDTQATNRIAGELLRRGLLEPFAGYGAVRAEVVRKPPGHTGSVKGLPRFDFHLDDHAAGRPPCWLEVKSVTLARDGTALFPDAVTSRGARHVEELGGIAAAGDETAALLFLVQRADPRRFAPNDETDPAFGAALRRSVERGLEVHVRRLRIEPVAGDDGPLEVVLDGALPLELSRSS